MAHSCRNCGCNKIDCGCKDSYLTTPPPCPTPEDCPDAQPCSEVFDAECIIYNGTPLTCAEATIVPTGMSVAEALDRIIDYFCGSGGGSNAIVEAGDGIAVTSSTVGNTTTYTVSAVCPLFVEISVVSGGRLQANVSGGTAPYTYVWSMADNWLNGQSSMYVLSPLVNPNQVSPVVATPIDPNHSFDYCFGDPSGKIGLAKVVVTDANGCKASDTYLLLTGQCN